MGLKDWVIKTRELFGNRKLIRSLEEYEARLEHDPRSARLWLRHAELCQRTGRNMLALSSYRTAARLMFDGGQIGQAVAAVRMALKLAPTDEFLLAELKGLSQLPRAAGRLTPSPIRAVTIDENSDDAWLDTTEREFNYRHNFLPDTLVDRHPPVHTK